MKKGFVNFYEILLCCTKSSESMTDILTRRRLYGILSMQERGISLEKSPENGPGTIFFPPAGRKGD